MKERIPILQFYAIYLSKIWQLTNWHTNRWIKCKTINDKKKKKNEIYHVQMNLTCGIYLMTVIIT